MENRGVKKQTINPTPKNPVKISLVTARHLKEGSKTKSIKAIKKPKRKIKESPRALILTSESFDNRISFSVSLKHFKKLQEKLPRPKLNIK